MRESRLADASVQPTASQSRLHAPPMRESRMPVLIDPPCLQVRYAVGIAKRATRCARLATLMLPVYKLSAHGRSALKAITNPADFEKAKSSYVGSVVRSHVSPAHGRPLPCSNARPCLLLCACTVVIGEARLG